MSRSLRLLLIAAAPLLVVACAPSHIFTDAEVPAIQSLGDVMWAQAQAVDPAFKKIGAPAYTDEDYAQFGAVAGRLKLTAARTKNWSKGPAFDALADQLATNADALSTAASAHDLAQTSAALKAAKSTCGSCHKQFN